ncbi:tetratricopeptide repeat protein [Clostridium rectalis]|uniref:tetratricopeptide repeat protein n=1 Tax=Clostridium rectalis TaxID=2040295 RepID=UPI000F640C03|nr:tetratricopeptide repeat protein [Clostridium rectalis]
MDKSKKLYNKALKKYNNGYIDEAINICEKSISLNIKNSASINLKGLLLYLKGDLDSSRKLWKMNWHLNKDRVAEKYIYDSKYDIKKLQMYNIAVKLIKEIKINEALKILNKCKESDFNSINVNNYLSACYIKKGEYERALEHINKVLNINKKNKVALLNKKTLFKYGSSNNIKIKVVPVMGIIITSFIIILLIIYKPFIYKKSTPELSYESKELTTVNKTKEKNKNNNDIISKKELFPYNEIRKEIDSKNFNSIYNYVFKWKDKQLSINERSLLGKAIDILKLESGEYFYSSGCENINNKNYSDAIKELQRACEYGENQWYYPHAVYMLAIAYENTSDVESAIRYYSMYESNFKNDIKDYEETALYKLSLLYKNINIDKSKFYAKKLVSNFPESIYNNSNIGIIINN